MKKKRNLLLQKQERRHRTELENMKRWRQIDIDNMRMSLKDENIDS